ncbi:MAG: TRAP transporter substrate-binding protein [Pirellulales bacterium]|nr:TRAP transporter substrate-binding protein [Pirellulales bacterium]
MLKKSTFLNFLAGILVGVLLAAFGFSLFVRHRNLSRQFDSGRRVLKLGHCLDQNHPVHLAMVRMGELLAEKSGGSLQLEIFPNGQLGSETELVEQVQHGAVAITKTSTAPLEGFIPEMALFGIPYAFRDDAHFWQVLRNDIGKQLLAAGAAVGLHGLCYYDAGSRSFYTIDKRVMTPDDLAGLKIRVQNSKTAMDMVDALGASPTPIPYGELYTALQNRMVDGAENNPPSFHTSRHFEVCKFYLLDEHSRVPDILLMSESVWQSLTTQQQQWIQEAADESAEYQRGLWRHASDAAIEAVKKEGVEIHYPDKKLFAAKVVKMHQSYAGTVLGNLLQRVNEL